MKMSGTPPILELRYDFYPSLVQIGGLEKIDEERRLPIQRSRRGAIPFELDSTVYGLDPDRLRDLFYRHVALAFRLTYLVTPPC